MSDLKESIHSVKMDAKKLAALNTDEKNTVLKAIAEGLDKNRDRIIAANKEDLAAAKDNDLALPLQKRLVYDDKKIDDSIKQIEDLIGLDDPVGKELMKRELAPGLILTKKAAPIGVLGIIFESRPDAFIQISTLALKSGNAVVLKGGIEALRTNEVLFDIVKEASEKAGLDLNWILNLKDRTQVNEMLALNDEIDLIIPRGSNEFVRYIQDNTSIPVLGHADGICTTYIEKSADLDKAVAIAADGKLQYPAVCNATETILVDEEIAKDFLPRFKETTGEALEIRGDEAVSAIIDCVPASEEDFKTEYLAPVVSIAVVGDTEEAVDFINRYGSGHTDSIVSEDDKAVEYFQNNVDSACVFSNASTRFSDGYRFGLGAEVGIATGKIHARGPVGLEGLVTTKYILEGNGDIVADFADQKREFTHKDL